MLISQEDMSITSFCHHFLHLIRDLTSLKDGIYRLGKLGKMEQIALFHPVEMTVKQRNNTDATTWINSILFFVLKKSQHRGVARQSSKGEQAPYDSDHF